ncbi:MAG: phosphatase [Gammaproteobacteria bacterium]|nr:phosphatase [Gammaproteobacteria bacterium]
MRALVFDWDGVFNAGEKALGTTSGFAEADSMGVNMLRYALWRRDGSLPGVAIITGEPNASAEFFAGREHFDALYQRVKDKGAALADFCGRCGIEPRQVACLFDDINDIAMASQCGVRILIRRDASVLLREYLCRNAICDYVTASRSGCFAVREATELMLGLSGLFDEIVESRVAFDAQYQAYFTARQAIETDVVSVAGSH